MSEPVFPKVTADDGLVPDDWSCWVVADVHGVSGGLVRALAKAGVADGSGRWAAPRKTALVLLGDMVGRGPDTLGVLRLVDGLSAGARAAGGRVVYVRGNHEQALLDVVGGDGDALERWLAKGGRAALISLGVIAAQDRRPTIAAVERFLRERHPWLGPRLRATYPYALWRGVAMVHAGLPKGGPGALPGGRGATLDDGAFLRSGGAGTGEYSGYAGLRGVVVGHIPHIRPALYHGGRTLAIDTNAASQPGDVVSAAVTLVKLPEQGPLSSAREVSARVGGA